MQQHTCQIAVQFWSRGIMMLSLTQAGPGRGPSRVEVVPFDFDMTPGSHMLYAE